MEPVWKEAAKVAGIYAVFGVLWILLSDQALLLLAPDAPTLSQMQTYKGWFYVALTAGLLFVLVSRSLARLREAEARALRLQKLEALGRMAGGVAHDFNNVLTVVTGMVDLAKQGSPRGGVQRGQLEQALLAAERGQDLVKSLMAYGRLKPSKPLRLDLAYEVEECLPLLSKMLKPQVQLHKDLRPARVWADPLQVQQLLMNLVANANDALPQGGTLELRCGVEAGEAVLVAKDDGVGMDEATRQRIFEPFFSTKGDQGTGLGLATVESIVQQLGGRIQVDSAPGKGCCFTVRLPLAAAL